MQVVVTQIILVIDQILQEAIVQIHLMVATRNHLVIIIILVLIQNLLEMQTNQLNLLLLIQLCLQTYWATRVVVIMALNQRRSSHLIQSFHHTLVIVIKENHQPLALVKHE